MSERTRIVILGGGFAGVTVAKQLERGLGNAAEITLIDNENFFTFTPLLPEAPSGSLEPKHIVFPLRALLRKTAIRQSQVSRVDLVARTITARHCHACGPFTVGFDHLVLALGSIPSFLGLPGVAEHALTIKSLADATGLHAHVVDRLEHADLETEAAARRRLMTFVVGGGGFAGVETLAELNDFVRSSRRFYKNIGADEIRFVLIHSGDRILPEVNPSLSRYALKKLESRKVEILLKTRINSFDGRTLRLSNGESLEIGTLIWAAGTAPSPLLSLVDVPRVKGGKVEADVTMAVKDRPGIWALGDCAAIPDLARGGVCPPTAQHALRQAKTLARNLQATIAGGELKPFKYKPLGLLAGLGRRAAVAEICGWKFSGFFAWWLWRTIYLLKLPGWERKLRVAIDWTLDLFFSRDLVYLRPLHLARGPGVELATEEQCPLQISSGARSDPVHAAT